MEMINRCLEITADKRAELDEYDRRNAKRMKMEERAAWREASPTFGNRKERRRQAALERQSKERV